MFVADLRRLGFLALQDHSADTPLEMRMTTFATRVLGRDETTGDILTGFDANDTDHLAEGDLLGGAVWRNNDERPIPGWAFAWPAIAQEEDSHGTTAGKALLRPLRSAWLADERFVTKEVALPEGIDEVEAGAVGIVLAGTEETRQEDLFFPMSPAKLIAVNRAPPAEKGTFVYDLDDEGKASNDWRARLQSMMRVVRPAVNTGSLAWQLTRSGVDSLDGYGLVYGQAAPALGGLGRDSRAQPDARNTGAGDAGGTRTRDSGVDNGTTSTKPTTGGSGGASTTRGDRPGVLAYASAAKGGPFDVGGFVDQHRHGLSRDGEPINAVHNPTNVLFRGHGGDAPLEFQQVAYVPPRSLPGRAKVHLQYDGAAAHSWGSGRSGQGLWRWVAETAIYVPEDPRLKPPGVQCTVPPLPPNPPPPGGGGDPKGDPKDPKGPVGHGPNLHGHVGHIGVLPPSGSCDRPKTGAQIAGVGPSVVTPVTGTITTAMTGGDGHDKSQGQPGTPGGPSYPTHPAGYPGPAVAATTGSLQDFTSIAYSSGIEDAIAYLYETQAQPNLLGITGTPAQPEGNKTIPSTPPAPVGTRPYDPTQGQQAAAYLHMQLMASALLLQPQMISEAADDLRANPTPTEDQIRGHVRSPAVVRIEAMGHHQAGEWLYTQNPQTGRFAGGTASGALVVMPPEVDAADYVNGFEPLQGTTSSAGLVWSPGTYQGFGTFDPAIGVVSSGTRIEQTELGYRVKPVDADGVLGTNQLLFGEGGFNITGNTSVTGRITGSSTIRLTEQGSTPSTPPSGTGEVYFKSDGLYYIDDAGVEVGPLGTGGGGGGGPVTHVAGGQIVPEEYVYGTTGLTRRQYNCGDLGIGYAADNSVTDAFVTNAYSYGVIGMRVILSYLGGAVDANEGIFLDFFWRVPESFGGWTGDGLTTRSRLYISSGSSVSAQLALGIDVNGGGFTESTRTVSGTSHSEGSFTETTISTGSLPSVSPGDLVTIRIAVVSPSGIPSATGYVEAIVDMVTLEWEDSSGGGGGATTLDELTDVALDSTLAEGQILVYAGTAGWVNSDTIDGDLTVTGKLTVDGLIDPTGLELAPVAANPGGVAANTFWLDSTASNKPKLGTRALFSASELDEGLVPVARGGFNTNINNQTTGAIPYAINGDPTPGFLNPGAQWDLLYSTGLGGPAYYSLTDYLDGALSTTDSALLGRSSTGWAAIAATTANYVLTSGGSNAPAFTQLTSLLDALFSPTQGSVLYRGASAWAALAYGDAGYPLVGGGAGGNPSWVGTLGLANGVNTAPTYSFASDPNTGMYHTGTADTMALVQGGNAGLLISTTACVVQRDFYGERHLVVARTSDGAETLSGLLLTNTGATGTVTRSLPNASGVKMAMKRLASHAFRMSPGTGISFRRVDGTLETAGKYLELASDGAYLQVIRVSATELQCIVEVGTITVEP